MRISLRFILPLGLVLGLVAYGVVPLVDVLAFRWFGRDLDIRARLIANTIQDGVVDSLHSGKSESVKRIFDRAIQDERLFAVGFCNLKNHLVYGTQTFPKEIRCQDVLVQEGDSPGTVLRLETGALHILAVDVQKRGKIVLLHDMSFITKRSTYTKKYIFGFFALLAAVISLITVVIAQISMRGLVSGMRALLRGESLVRPLSRIRSPELLPLAKDLRALVRDLERERRVKDEAQITWVPKTLKKILNEDLIGDEVLIVSNREPYIHVKKGDQIEIQVPASGLVTALEPVMRACSGTWIAHGSGSADREAVDAKDHVQVPPDEPSYQIRRVWLTPEEEAGYYYGFANEGLWPLCHIAHTRPTFRSSDWNHYVAVNRKFAEAVFQEAKTDDPVVLVQDYHFALLPKMIREKLPNATIISFWHIPWPNHEAFGICPWREEILEGLLGSSVVGFHTAYHCNHFIESVDRFLEARIDRESSTVSFGGKPTVIQSYPISIEWPPRWIKTQKSISECRYKVREMNGLPQNLYVGVGVDRLDYTKGIVERFLAVERLMEMNPEWVGRFSFIQIAAPSRSSIEQYQNFDQQVRALAERINQRFARPGYKPIILKVEHHEPDQVFEYYRGSDLCMVTSLHDGMNLVAKEFIGARDDDRGVLILSQFTGAARELPEALVVNPYNIDQCAVALQVALLMPLSEQTERMRAMRGLVQEFNVFRWAGRMLIDAGRIRSRQRLMGRISLTDAALHGKTSR
ncbi:MAG: trehalose-6-phosphate synthase [Bdellovibrionales bacterium]|nr:trehalose-6-phosphate synthase [Bdellovibrionales bacterium]